MNRRKAIVREITEFNKYLDPHLSIQANRSEDVLIVNMYYGNKSVAHVQCNLEAPNHIIHLELGRTNKNYRRQGYGTQIRAIILWCAKRAGYKLAFQDSIFMANSNTSRPRPPSAYIMNKLGFNHQNRNNNGSEHRYLNLNRNIPAVNAVIRQIMA